MPIDLFEKHGVDLLENKTQPSDIENPGFLKRLGRGYLDYAGGALRGMGQSAGDLAASALNAPISGLEYLTGKQLPHIPHPQLINENPESLGASIGQTLGQFAGGMALPGGAGIKAAQLANRGYGAIKSGKQLPLIGKLLAGAAGGAAEGALGNEDNRILGAEIGGLLGGSGQGISSALKAYKGMKSSNIARQIQDEMNHLNQHFSERFTGHLGAGEEAGANRFLKAERAAKIPLLKKAGEGKLVYGLEKFNEHPTLENAHRAQSDLNRIVAKYARSKEGSLESDVHAEALKLKNRMLKKISEAFEKAGAHEHGAGYNQARMDYAKEVAPYLDSPAIAGLLGKSNKRGVQTIRPSQFADKLLQEESFLAQAGHKHPGLLQREKTKQILGNPLVQKGLGGAALIGGGLLPYEIAKLLGLK